MAASHTSALVMGTPFKLLQTGTLFSGVQLMRLPALLRDVYYGGPGVITGTVEEKGTPANTPLRRRVVLIEERSRTAIRETWSDADTGAYTFRHIATGMKYTVLTYDHAGNYRAVAADGLTPEVRP